MKASLNDHTQNLVCQILVQSIRFYRRIFLQIVVPKFSGFLSGNFGTWKGIGFLKWSLFEVIDPLKDEAADILPWTVAKFVGEKDEGKETAEGALLLTLSVTSRILSTTSSGREL